MKRRRWRTAALWVGCTMCVWIAAGFVVSAFWQIAIQTPGTCGWSLVVVAGSASIETVEMPTYYPMFAELQSYGLSRWNAWEARRVDLPQIQFSYLTFEFPLYAVFLAALLPTLLVWRFGRKSPKPGHCRCGYNLTGNMSGVCPECGRDS